MTDPHRETDESWDARQALSTFGQRFLAWIIDGLLLGAVNALILELGDIDLDLRDGHFEFSEYWPSLVVSAVYAIFFIGNASGQTLGMRVMGIRAIDATTGTRVTYGTAVIRHVVSLASGFVLLLGYFWMLGDPRRQTWHDKAANTLVVNAAAYPVDRGPG